MNLGFYHEDFFNLRFIGFCVLASVLVSFAAFGFVCFIISQVCFKGIYVRVVNKYAIPSLRFKTSLYLLLPCQVLTYAPVNYASRGLYIAALTS
jgi:hypothetical protein